MLPASKRSEKQVRRTPERWDTRMNPPARLTSHAHQQCSDTLCRHSDDEKSTILVTGSCISTVLFLLVMKPICQFDRARFRKWAALLGLLIFGLFVTVQVLHAHPLGQADDLHCSLCLAAHATATILALPTLPVLASVLARTSPVEPQLLLITRSARYFIRPPPAIA